MHIFLHFMMQIMCKEMLVIMQIHLLLNQIFGVLTDLKTLTLFNYSLYEL